jgi:hypothetical protein
MSFATKTYALAAAFLAITGLAVVPAHAQSPNLRSPTDVRGFYTNLPGNALGNATGNFTFIVWKGDSSEADSTWGGYRVRRTIFGVSPLPFEVVGLW